MITYENQNGRKINGSRRWEIDVRLDGRIVGEIRSVASGYQYKPAGGKPGDTLPTIEAVKQALEGGVV